MSLMMLYPKKYALKVLCGYLYYECQEYGVRDFENRVILDVMEDAFLP